MDFDTIIVRFGEMSTKGKNKKDFINGLARSIRHALKDFEDSFDMLVRHDHIYINIKEEIPNLIDTLKEISGMYSFSLAKKIDQDIDNIVDVSFKMIVNHEGNTFKVKAKRIDKAYPFISDEINRMVAKEVLSKSDKKVDVHNPDYLLKIEIRNDYTYIYSKEIKALGGYPLGVAGKGLLMLSGGIDSPVAGYLAMKRGIKLECIYFESPPHTSVAAKNKVKELVHILTKYQPSITLHIINFTNIQESIYKNIDPTYMITIMRRMMYRISEKVLKERNCYVLINGESVGQVASQTLTSMQVINNVTNLPVIRPVACLDKLEIIDISKKIGTYETSILPYEDCCTIFLPKHPVINPRLDKCLEYEKKFNWSIQIEEAINNMETIDITQKNNK
ncbi:MAG: tRNA 4-thiouridine(8) synthase ThiI, partial [bacterium]|nr:tRNA 4-thiouridine(8) synthase ThiI [bacterium]